MISGFADAAWDKTIEKSVRSKNILEWKMKRTHILSDTPCSRIPIIVDGFMIKSVLFGGKHSAREEAGF